MQTVAFLQVLSGPAQRAAAAPMSRASCRASERRAAVTLLCARSPTVATSLAGGSTAACSDKGLLAVNASGGLFGAGLVPPEPD